MKLTDIARNPFTVHLHMHSSLSGAPAAMSAQNFMALQAGAGQILWWTDEDWRMAGHGCVSGADFEAESLSESERVYASCDADRDPPTRFTQMEKQWVEESGKGNFSIAEVCTTADRALSGTRSLKFRVATSEEAFQPLYYRLTSGREATRRTLAAGIVARLGIFPVGPLTADVRFILRLVLSEQPSGDVCELRYVITRGPLDLPPEEGRAVAVIPLGFNEDQWNYYELNVTRDATEFRLGGEDNGLTAISLGVEARKGGGMVFFDHLQIHQRLNGRQVLERQRAMASRLDAEDRTNYVGLEISYGPHVAAYGVGLEPPDYEKALNGLTMRDAVSFVQAQKGIASLCHPLSARPGSLATLVFGKGLPANPLDRVDRISQKLLAEDVYEADMIEVAYEEEALPASLRLWDMLSAAGYAVTGVGVSNSHSMHEGWKDGFVTWVYAETRSEADLLDALKRGRACFGRAGLFSGKLDLSTPAGHRMGTMALVQSDAQVVNVLMEGAPANSCIVVMVNGERAGILSGGEGQVVREVNVDTRANAFVRVVVESGDGIPIAFSNPIYFVRTAPKHGLPPHRALKLALKLK